ncbi:MAG: cell envelope integrity protein CreD, partial [Saprospiraceae bacterium]
NQNSFNTGLSCKFPIVEGKTSYHFNLKMSLKGSSSLLFSPIAKTTQVKLSSAFKDPSFVGEFLPEHNLSNSGFEANWKILEYNKSIPSLLKDTYTIDLGKNLFGVIIKTPVDNYAKTTRACKYMILFIALIFLSIFLTEILRNIQVHVFQYALMGFALIIFFALLLCVSEFVTFNVAYFIASSAVIIMIYMYSLSIFHHIQSTRLLSGLVICLFGFIFIIIQLEQMALLVGTVGLFVILGICMYVTRKIKWYEDVSTD